MIQRTATEARQNYIDKMGERLGEVFFALCNEVVWLETNWHEYVVLYGMKPERIDLLNKAAPAFFASIDDMIWEHTILTVTRLTDPSKKRKHSRLTIALLSELVDPTLKASVQRSVSDVVLKAKFCRDWRDRRIAHRDLSLALKRQARPIADRTRADMNAVIEAIANLLNIISVHYMDSSIRFRITRTTTGATGLLHVLDDGIKAQEERDQKIVRDELPRSTRWRKEI